MVANIGGALLMMVLTALPFGAIYLILTRTKAMDGVKLNNGWTATDLRKNFKYVVAAGLLIVAIGGWFAGPTLLEAAGVVP